MEHSLQAERIHLQTKIINISNAVTALKNADLLAGPLLEDTKKYLNYSDSIFSGSYKFTLLIQGDSKTGKTTFLNALLDDVIIPSSNLDSIVIVQYEEDASEPELFTAQLNEIFDSEKKIFMVKPEKLTATSIKGRHPIHDTLKHTTQDDSTPVAPQFDRTVYVIKYRISWLKQMIKDDFILNRIQFVDLGVSSGARFDSESLLMLEKITSSEENGDVFLADGQKLFTENIASKYEELTPKKERSLLVMNRTDLLGSEEHFKKIKKHREALCSELKMDEQKIAEIIEEQEETEQIRSELFLRSFYESQNMDPKNVPDNDLLYFTSALFAVNKILLNTYQECTRDEEKPALCLLFKERNKGNKLFQANEKSAKKKDMDVLQYYLEHNAEMYLNIQCMEPVKKAVGRIAFSHFEKLRTTIEEEMTKIKNRLVKCETYVNEKLTEEEIEELKIQRNIVEEIFRERRRRININVKNFKEQYFKSLETFEKKVKEIHPDYFFVKANRKEQLLGNLRVLTEQWANSQKEFYEEYIKIESETVTQLENLIKKNQGKLYLDNYITNYAELQCRQMKIESLSVMNVIYSVSSAIGNDIESFVNDGKGSGYLKIFSKIFDKLFGKDKKSVTFEAEVKNTKEVFDRASDNIMERHNEEEQLREGKFNSDFEGYLKSAESGNIEKARNMIKEYFSDLQ